MTEERLDLMLRGSGGDGLVERPLDRLREPRVAAEINGRSAGVDAGYEVVRDAQDHLLGHPATIADLLADSTSDSILCMTTIATFAQGYDAATKAIEELSAILDESAMHDLTMRNIIPSHVRDADEYREGTSTAWADYNARLVHARRREIVWYGR